MISGHELERLYVTLMGDKTHLDKVYADAIKQTHTVAEKMAAVGSSMTKFVTAPIAAVGAMSVHAFADFDLAMTKTTAIMEVTEGQIKAMRDAAVDMSTKGTRSAHDIGEAMYFLAAAGMKAESVIATMPVVINFAAAGAFDLHTASRLATTSVMALGLASHDATEYMQNMTRVTDVVVRISKMAEASTESFARALTRDAAAVMQQYGISVEQGVAVLGAYARQNILAEHAGSTFGRMVRLLTSAAVKKAAAFKEAGVAVFDAGGKMRNVGDIIADLERAMKGLSSEEKVNLLEKLGFKTLSQKALLPLIGMSAQIKDFEAQLNKAGGTAEKIAGRQLKAFTSQMLILKNQITAVGIEIGAMIAPALQQMSEGIKQVLEGWRALSPETKRFIVIAAAIAASIGPLLLGLGAIPFVLAGIKAGLVVLVPLLPFIIGLGLAVGGFIADSGGLEKAWQRAQAAFQQFVDFVRPVWDATVAFFVAAWPTIVEVAKFAFGVIKRNVSNFVEGVRFAIGFLLGNWSMSWAEIRDAIVEALQIATFAIENFEVAARWRAVKIAQHFYDMANNITLGVGGAIDDFTLGIGKMLKQEEEAAKMAFQTWKEQRAKAQGEGKKAADALVPPHHADKMKQEAGKVGKNIGKALADGFKSEASNVEAALWGTAEALERIAAYRDFLRGKGGAGEGVAAGPKAMMPAGERRQGADPAGPLLGQQVVNLLKDIRDNTKDDGDDIDIDVADLE